ncbi:hypothetical protein [Cupriavidus necator]|uniref:hypothetical protein n=1 Tax=Cupriavidus necator TaxID=106590 RepID=UPI00339D3B30
MSIADRRLTVLAPASLDACWPVVGGFLNDALAHSEGELTADDIREMVKAERAFVLVVIESGEIIAAGAVEINEYPRYRVANIIAVGGQRVFLRRSELDWLRMVVRDMGCAKLQTYCRPSMARLLERLGMREAYRVMRLDT